MSINGDNDVEIRFNIEEIIKDIMLANIPDVKNIANNVFITSFLLFKKSL